MPQSRPAVKARRLSPSIVVAALLATVLAVEVVVAVLGFLVFPASVHDFPLYRDAALSWLRGDGFYHAYQFAPYTIRADEILYPPTFLLLIVPFTVLPAFLWWAIPMAIIGWGLREVRGWRLVAVLLCLSLPLTNHGVSWALDHIVNGNPTIWAAAGVTLATRYGVGPLALVKPTPFLLPFALIGIRTRAWWLTAAILCIVSLAFLPMWFDYVRVLANSSGASLVYMAGSVPLMLAAYLGWISRGASPAAR